MFGYNILKTFAKCLHLSMCSLTSFCISVNISDKPVIVRNSKFQVIRTPNLQIIHLEINFISAEKTFCIDHWLNLDQSRKKVRTLGTRVAQTLASDKGWPGRLTRSGSPINSNDIKSRPKPSAVRGALVKLSLLLLSVHEIESWDYVYQS